MPDAHLIIDQGGHSSRALLYDPQGTLLFASQHSVAIQQPQKNFYEQDVQDLLQSVDSCLNNIPAGPWQIRSAAVITQRSSFVACNKYSLQAITPLISWQDTRNAAWLQQKAFDVQTLKQITGLRLNGHYGASKMRWLLDHDAAVQQAAKHNELVFLPLAAFLSAHLTHSTSACCDAVSASRTFLTALGSCTWDDTLLTHFDLDKQHLPELVPSQYAFGTIEVAQQQVPLQVVGGDQSFMPFAYGTAAVANSLFINAGTGAFVQCALETAECPHGLLSSHASIGAQHALTVAEGTVNSCASALDWLWQQHGHILSPQEIAQALQQEQDPPVFHHRISALGSPYWLPAGESVFAENASLSAQCVAVIESVLFLLAINVDLLKQAKPDLQQIYISGGMARLDGFCHKLAILCELPVIRHHDQEASARGALFFLCQQQSYHPVQDPDRFEPQIDRTLLARYQQFYETLRQEWMGRSG